MLSTLRSQSHRECPAVGLRAPGAVGPTRHRGGPRIDGPSPASATRCPRYSIPGTRWRPLPDTRGIRYPRASATRYPRNPLPDIRCLLGACFLIPDIDLDIAQQSLDCSDSLSTLSRMASSYSERLATGPLLRGDVERVVAVLLRGLERLSGSIAPEGNEAAPMTAAPTSSPNVARSRVSAGGRRGRPQGIGRGVRSERRSSISRAVGARPGGDCAHLEDAERAVRAEAQTMSLQGHETSCPDGDVDA